MPEHLRRALKSGQLSDGDLAELITIRAAQIGLSFRQALKAFDKDRLPRNAAGADLGMLIGLLRGVAA